MANSLPDWGFLSRLLLVAGLATGLLLFFIFDIQQYLNLDHLRKSRVMLQEIYTQYPISMMTVFFLVYVVTTSLSLPGATILTLAGGAVFGRIGGTILVSFASTIGATLAMLIARFILQNWVEQRFSSQLNSIYEGIKTEGEFYLFTLRLIPVIPFFVINLGMGLTPIRAWSFYWVSQLGMLAGTLVYVNAGAELGQIDSMNDILSPMLIGSFVLLGLFPLLAKKLVLIIRTEWNQKSKP